MCVTDDAWWREAPGHILKVLLVLSVGQAWTRVVAYSPE